MQNEPTELEKLDAIRSRLNVSFDDAKRALDEAGGDVVKALTRLESTGQDLVSLGVEVLSDIQKLIGAAAAKKLRIRYGGRLVKEAPISLTATAALILGIAAVLITKASLEIEREELAERKEE